MLGGKKTKKKTTENVTDAHWEGARLAIFEVFVSVFEERLSCLPTPTSHTGNDFPSLITNVWQGRRNSLALINREVPYLRQMC